MKSRMIVLGVVVVFIFSLSGCVTTRKNEELVNQGLKNRIMALESELNEKDNEINSLKESLIKSSELLAWKSIKLVRLKSTRLQNKFKLL